MKPTTRPNMFFCIRGASAVCNSPRSLYLSVMTVSGSQMDKLQSMLRRCTSDSFVMSE
jgi:hypothetical protein